MRSAQQIRYEDLMILTLFFGKSLGLSRAHLPLLFKVALIANKNDSHLFISMIPYLLKPLSDGFEGTPA